MQKWISAIPSSLTNTARLEGLQSAPCLSGCFLLHKIVISCFCATKSRSPYRPRQMCEITCEITFRFSMRGRLSVRLLLNDSFLRFRRLLCTSCLCLLFFYLLSRYTPAQRCPYYNPLFRLRQAAFFFLLYSPKMRNYFWCFFTMVS